MTNSEINEFLGDLSFDRDEIVGKLERLQKTLDQAMPSVLGVPKYKSVNQYNETREEYQKWLRSQADGWLTADCWSMGTRIVMAHLWNKINHDFDQKLETYWHDEYEGKLAWKNDYPYFEFKQSDLAKELGMTNKGLRQILISVSDCDRWIQRHPFKYNYWVFNGEAVTRSYER